MPFLHHSEPKLEKNPALADIFNNEISKLNQSDYVAKLNAGQITESQESGVAPLKLLTIPRLELSAAPTRAQLSKQIKSELTVPTDRTFHWSYSTVVLTWLHESCRYKTSVANRIVEILKLTSPSEWRYVHIKQQSTDDITQSKPLKDLTTTHR